MHPLSFHCSLNFHTFPRLQRYCMPALCCHQNEAEEKVCACIFTVYFSFLPFISVSDSTQRRRLCDRSRLQPRLWLYCQSYMWREGGECGRQTHTDMYESVSVPCVRRHQGLLCLWLTTPPTHIDIVMNVSWDLFFPCPLNFISYN